MLQLRRWAIAAALVLCLVPRTFGESGPIRIENYTPPVKVACIGDSITAGAGVLEPGVNAYPAQLGKLLGPNFKVLNFGVSGRTMLNSGDHPYQKEKAYEDAVKAAPDVVIIMLGTNDTKPKNWQHIDQFPADAKTMIARFAALKSKPRIFLAYPVPVVGAGNYKITEDGVKAEQPMIDAIAKEAGVDVIDLHTPLLDKPQLIPDRVHPNAEGAGVIARTVYKALTGQEPPTPATKEAR